MYLGPVNIVQKSWRDVYYPGLGTLSFPAGPVVVEHQRYRCDHCGRIAEVLGKATEPFYCRDCNHLISIDEECAEPC